MRPTGKKLHWLALALLYLSVIEPLFMQLSLPTPALAASSGLPAPLDSPQCDTSFLPAKSHDGAILTDIDLTSILRDTTIPQEMREHLGSNDDRLASILKRYPSNTEYYVESYTDPSTPHQHIVACATQDTDGGQGVADEINGLFNPIAPLELDSIDYMDIIGDPVQRIAFANPRDEVALTGEPCPGGIQGRSSDWSDKNPPCPSFQASVDDTLIANDTWDAPRVDPRVAMTLAYLVAPKSEGGAGREFIRVKSLSKVVKIGSPDGSAVDDTASASQTSFSAEPYELYQDDNPYHPDKVASVVDIDQIDQMRTTTQIVEHHLFTPPKVSYKYSPPTPVNVSWQTDSGSQGASLPNISGLSQIQNARYSANQAIIQMLNAGGIGDLNVDVDGADISNFSDAATLVGQSLVEGLFGSPAGSLSGFDLTSTLNSIARAYLTQELGLLPGSLSKGDDFEGITQNIGQTAVEYAMGLSKGSLTSEDGSSQGILESAGRRYLEATVFKVSQGTLTPSEAYPLNTVGDMLQRLGEGRIEFMFTLPSGSLRQTSYDDFRRSSLKASLIFSSQAVSADEFSMADYVSGQLALAGPSSGADMYGFTKDDYAGAVASLENSRTDDALRKFKQLVGARAIIAGIGAYKVKGTATAERIPTSLTCTLSGSVTLHDGIVMKADDANGANPFSQIPVNDGLANWGHRSDDGDNVSPAYPDGGKGDGEPLDLCGEVRSNGKTYPYREIFSSDLRPYTYTYKAGDSAETQTSNKAQQDLGYVSATQSGIGHDIGLQNPTVASDTQATALDQFDTQGQNGTIPYGNDQGSLVNNFIGTSLFSPDIIWQKIFQANDDLVAPPNYNMLCDWNEASRSHPNMDKQYRINNACINTNEILYYNNPKLLVSVPLNGVDLPATYVPGVVAQSNDNIALSGLGNQTGKNGNAINDRGGHPYALKEGDKVAVFHQTDPTTNGFYAASAGQWNKAQAATVTLGGALDVILGNNSDSSDKNQKEISDRIAAVKNRLSFLQSMMAGQAGQLNELGLKQFDLTGLASLANAGTITDNQINQSLSEWINLLNSHPADATYGADYGNAAKTGWIFAVTSLQDDLRCIEQGGAPAVPASLQEGTSDQSGNACQLNGSGLPSSQDTELIEGMVSQLEGLLGKLRSLSDSMVDSLQSSTLTGTAGVGSGQSAMSSAAGLPGNVAAVNANGQIATPGSGSAATTLLTADPMRALVAPNVANVTTKPAGCALGSSGCSVTGGTVMTSTPYADGNLDTLFGDIGAIYVSRKFTSDKLAQQSIAYHLRRDIASDGEGTNDPVGDAQKILFRFGIATQPFGDQGLTGADFSRIFQLDEATDVFGRIGEQELELALWNKTGMDKTLKKNPTFKGIASSLATLTTKISFYLDHIDSLVDLVEGNPGAKPPVKSLEELMNDVNSRIDSLNAPTVAGKKELSAAKADYHSLPDRIKKATQTVKANRKDPSVKGQQKNADVYLATIKSLGKDLAVFEKYGLKTSDAPVKALYDRKDDIKHVIDEMIAGKTLPDRDDEKGHAPSSSILGKSSFSSDCVTPDALLRTILKSRRVVVPNGMIVDTHNVEVSLTSYASYIGGCKIDKYLSLPVGSVYGWYQLGNTDFNHAGELDPGHTQTPALPGWKSGESAAWSYDAFKLAVGYAEAISSGNSSFPNLAKNAPQITRLEIGGALNPALTPATISGLMRRGDKIIQSSAVLKLAGLIPGLGAYLKEYKITGSDIASLLAGNSLPLLAKVGGAQLDKLLNLPQGTAASIINPVCHDESGHVAPCDGSTPARDPDNVRSLTLASYGLRKLGISTGAIPQYFDLAAGGDPQTNWGNAVLTEDLGLAVNSWSAPAGDNEFAHSNLYTGNSSLAATKSQTPAERLLSAFGFLSPAKIILRKMQGELLNAIAPLQTRAAGTTGDSLLSASLTEASSAIYGNIDSFIDAAALSDMTSADSGYWPNSPAYGGNYDAAADKAAQTDIDLIYSGSGSLLKQLWDATSISGSPDQALTNSLRTIVSKYLLVPYGVNPSDYSDDQISGIIASHAADLAAQFKDKNREDYKSDILSFNNRVNHLDSTYFQDSVLSGAAQGSVEQMLTGKVSANDLAHQAGGKGTKKFETSAIADVIQNWLDKQDGSNTLKEVDTYLKAMLPCGHSDWGIAKTVANFMTGDGGTCDTTSMNSSDTGSTGSSQSVQTVPSACATLTVYSGHMSAPPLNCLLYDPRYGKLRGLFFDQVLGRVFSSDLEDKLNIQEGTFRAMAVNPRNAEQIMISQGVFYVSNQVFGRDKDGQIGDTANLADCLKYARSNGASGDVKKCSPADQLRYSLKDAFMAGFCDVTHTSENCSTTFNTERASAKLNRDVSKAIDYNIRTISKRALGVEVTKSDVDSIIRGDMKALDYLAAGIVIFQSNKALLNGKETKGNPRTQQFLIRYSDIRPAFSENSATRQDISREKGNEQGAYLAVLASAPDGKNPLTYANSVYVDGAADTSSGGTMCAYSMYVLSQSTCSSTEDQLSYNLDYADSVGKLSAYYAGLPADAKKSLQVPGIDLVNDPQGPTKYAVQQVNAQLDSISSDAVDTANRQARQDAQARLKYKLYDQVAFMADQNIPVNFTARMAQGTYMDKSDVVAEYVVNRWIDPHGKLGLTANPDVIDNLLNAIIAPTQEERMGYYNNLLTSSGANILDTDITKYFADKFDIHNVPTGLVKSFFVWGSHGFSSETFNSGTLKDSSGKPQTSLGQAMRGYVEDVAFKWADKQTGFKPGTFQKIAEIYEAGRQMYIAQAAFNQAVQGNDLYQIANDSQKLAHAQLAFATLVKEFILYEFSDQMSQLDTQLGLPPGLTAQLVGIGLTILIASILHISFAAASGGPLAPYIMAALLLYTLIFGVTKIDQTSYTNADGYYPYYKYGTWKDDLSYGKSVSPLGAAGFVVAGATFISNIWGSSSVHRTAPAWGESRFDDPIYGDFSSTDPYLYQTGIRTAARNKVRGVISDLLSMPTSSFVASLGYSPSYAWPPQIFAWGDETYDPTNGQDIQNLITQTAPWQDSSSTGYGDLDTRCSSVTMNDEESAPVCNINQAIRSGVFGSPIPTTFLHLHW